MVALGVVLWLSVAQVPGSAGQGDPQREVEDLRSRVRFLEEAAREHEKHEAVQLEVAEDHTLLLVLMRQLDDLRREVAELRRDLAAADKGLAVVQAKQQADEVQLQGLDVRERDDAVKSAQLVVAVAQLRELEAELQRQTFALVAQQAFQRGLLTRAQYGEVRQGINAADKSLLDKAYDWLKDKGPCLLFRLFSRSSVTTCF